MKEILHIDSLDLCCDTCQHVIPQIELDAKWIGHPCPQCGSDMLTQADYDKSVGLAQAAALLNRLLGPVSAVKQPTRPFMV